MYVVYSVTCANKSEAEKIAAHCVSLHLVACTKRVPVSSMYPWKGKIENAEEVLLMMDGKEKDFEKIEAEIRKLHSYEEFVLIASPIIRINSGAKAWMEEELK